MEHQGMNENRMANTQARISSGTQGPPVGNTPHQSHATARYPTGCPNFAPSHSSLTSNPEVRPLFLPPNTNYQHGIHQFREPDDPQAYINRHREGSGYTDQSDQQHHQRPPPGFSNTEANKYESPYMEGLNSVDSPFLHLPPLYNYFWTQHGVQAVLNPVALHPPYSFSANQQHSQLPLAFPVPIGRQFPPGQGEMCGPMNLMGNPHAISAHPQGVATNQANHPMARTFQQSPPNFQMSLPLRPIMAAPSHSHTPIRACEHAERSRLAGAANVGGALANNADNNNNNNTQTSAFKKYKRVESYRLTRADSGQIQVPILERELVSIREGYSPNNSMALAIFDKEQSTTLQRLFPNDPLMRRARITQDEWVKLCRLRGKTQAIPRLGGKLPRDIVERGNRVLEANLDKQRKAWNAIVAAGEVFTPTRGFKTDTDCAGTQRRNIDES